ncbi:hypothetical protein [Acinetobacter faecalis]|uniref:hypothetical protein n=1 Tax=Acinetobacter faecalis TaxID=2665161 RepID=UPI002A91FC76|nr:hypothetical protein [Acinetobacter faecalis]MDY6456182.1 hypothetical protein [Acinetobacter faecalis]
MKALIALSIVMFASTAYATTPEKWVTVAKGEYGQTFVNSNHIKSVTGQPSVVEYGYKYIYKYGVPSLQLAPNAYIQAIHQINCKERTKATIMSQRFKPNGKAIDNATPFSTVYFEPIYDSHIDLIKVYKYVCKAKNKI